MNASRTALSSNPYRLRRTQAVSSNTVFEIQIGSAANSDRAAAACLRSSSVSSRTRTLVSTAIITPNHLTSNGRPHLREGFRFTFGPQTACDLAEIDPGETAGGAKQNSITGFFDGKLCAGYPGTGSTNVLG